MGKSHSQNIDPRPKRRIDKDNPYRLFTVGAATSEPHYFIQFKDGNGTEHCLEIEKPLFELFDQFELDDLTRMNELDRHLDDRELSAVPADESEEIRMQSAELAALRNLESETLHSAILRLPEMQRRRLILFFYGELTHQQIADMEGCARAVVTKSIHKALHNLKIFLE